MRQVSKLVSVLTTPSERAPRWRWIPSANSWRSKPLGRMSLRDRRHRKGSRVLGPSHRRHACRGSAGDVREDADPGLKGTLCLKKGSLVQPIGCPWAVHPKESQDGWLNFPWCSLVILMRPALEKELGPALGWNEFISGKIGSRDWWQWVHTTETTLRRDIRLRKS